MQYHAISDSKFQIRLPLPKLVIVIYNVCHVEFLIEHSPSVSIRLRLFLSVPRPSTLFFPTILFFSVPFRCVCNFPYPCYTSVSVRLILSTFHIRIRSDLSEFRPHFTLFPLLFGYNPYQPNPVAPRPLIAFSLLLYYVPFRPYCSVMYKLRQAVVV